MPNLRDPSRDKAQKVSDSLVAERAVRIVAKSMFKELVAQGYTDRQVVQVASELLAQLNAARRTR